MCQAEPVEALSERNIILGDGKTERKVDGKDGKKGDRKLDYGS